MTLLAFPVDYPEEEGDFMCTSPEDVPVHIPSARGSKETAVHRCTWCGFVSTLGDPCQWAPGGKHETGVVDGKD